MTLGITQAHGVSMTLGTMADGTEDGIHTTHIMQDGTAASAGILTTIITITLAMSQEGHQTRIISEARDTRPVLKDSHQEEAARSEEAPA